MTLARQTLGKRGETIACEFLEKNGYKIIERNFRCNYGELDIIASKNKTLSFVEVKTRKNLKFGLPRLAVTYTKQQKIRSSAIAYLQIKHIHAELISFDVIGDYIDGLNYAELSELLIPGADEEETETFRQRYVDSLTSQAFGGNQADYKEKVLSLPGVGAVKVFPVWNGNISPQSLVPSDAVTAWYNSAISTVPANVSPWLTSVYTASNSLLLTVGGTVKLVIMNTAHGIPSEELIADVQIGRAHV